MEALKIDKNTKYLLFTSFDDGERFFYETFSDLDSARRKMMSTWWAQCRVGVADGLCALSPSLAKACTSGNDDDYDAVNQLLSLGCWSDSEGAEAWFTSEDAWLSRNTTYPGACHWEIVEVTVDDKENDLVKELKDIQRALEAMAVGGRDDLLGAESNHLLQVIEKLQASDKQAEIE